MRTRRAPWVLWLSIAVAAGCGGAVSQDAFDTAHAGDALDGGGSESGASGDDAGTSGKDAGGDPAKDGGGGANDAGTRPDTGGPPTGDPGISCGQGTNCMAGTQACCATDLGKNTQFTCQGANESCGGLKLPCDDQADCQTGVCCGTFDKNAGYTSVACKVACVGAIGNVSYVHFCDPKAPQDECANLGRACTGSSATLPGYHFCE